MLVLGIDPGLKGALALIADDETMLDIWDMPTLALTKSRRAIDSATLLEMIRSMNQEHGDFRVMAEAPGIRGKQAGGLTVGRNFGLIEGIFVARHYRFETVAPQTWQSKLLGKNRGKDANRIKAQALWPEADLGKRKTQDRSDAALIALYGLRSVKE